MYCRLQVRPLYTKEEVDEAIADLAMQLNDYYCGRSVIVVPILTGAMVFAGQLLPQLTFELLVEPIYMSRYMGTLGTQSLRATGEIADASNQRVLLLDEISDAGVTMKFAKSLFKLAKEVKTCTLCERQVNNQTKVDWNGLAINSEKFVVGSGMDISGWARNLPGIWELE